MLTAVRLSHQHLYVAPDNLLGTVAEDPPRRWIEIFDYSLLVDRDDSICDRVDDGAHPVLAVAELRNQNVLLSLRLFSPGDVESQALDARKLPGSIELVVGNIGTGKSRVLLGDCGAQGGGPACSHPHPYMTADNRRVIFNADRFGVCHVYAAHVTPEFLQSLE